MKILDNAYGKRSGREEDEETQYHLLTGVFSAIYALLVTIDMT